MVTMVIIINPLKGIKDDYDHDDVKLKGAGGDHGHHDDKGTDQPAYLHSLICGDFVIISLEIRIAILTCHRQNFTILAVAEQPGLEDTKK